MYIYTYTLICMYVYTYINSSATPASTIKAKCCKKKDKKTQKKPPFATPASTAHGLSAVEKRGKNFLRKKKKKTCSATSASTAHGAKFFCRSVGGQKYCPLKSLSCFFFCFGNAVLHVVFFFFSNAALHALS